jgi:predicted HD phosphohydrolase
MIHEQSSTENLVERNAAKALTYMNRHLQAKRYFGSLEPKACRQAAKLLDKAKSGIFS